MSNIIVLKCRSYTKLTSWFCVPPRCFLCAARAAACWRRASTVRVILVSGLLTAAAPKCKGSPIRSPLNKVHHRSLTPSSARPVRPADRRSATGEAPWTESWRETQEKRDRKRLLVQFRIIWSGLQSRDSAAVVSFWARAGLILRVVNALGNKYVSFL